MPFSVVPSLAYRGKIFIRFAVVKTALWFGLPVDIAYYSGCHQMLCQQLTSLPGELFLSFTNIDNFPNKLIFSWRFNKKSTLLSILT